MLHASRFATRPSRLKRVPILAAALFTAGALATGAVSAVVYQQVIADTGNVKLRIVRTVVNNGFDSGWHVHPGIVFIQVQEGSIQLYQNGCTATTVGAGQMFAETPHLAVRAIVTGSASWTTTMVVTGYDSPQIGARTYYSDPNFNPCPALSPGP